VLVAHSYGGFVITNAATDNPNVKALVYIDGFMPDQGETIGALGETWGSCVTESALNPVPSDGAVDLYLRWDANPPYEGYTECFANGVPAKQAAVLFAEQRPGAAAQFTEPSGEPAWKTIPSWALIGTEDKVIPPALQEMFTKRAGTNVTSVEAGHLSLITRPAETTELILSAVEAAVGAAEPVGAGAAG
jgi:pimeloyl-ACP methyl ester carboxylesterase